MSDQPLTTDFEQELSSRLHHAAAEVEPPVVSASTIRALAEADPPEVGDEPGRPGGRWWYWAAAAAVVAVPPGRRQ